MCKFKIVKTVSLPFLRLPKRSASREKWEGGGGGETSANREKWGWAGGGGGGGRCHSIWCPSYWDIKLRSFD